MSIRIIFCPNNSQKSDKRKWVARCNVVWCMFIMFTFEVGSSLVKSTVQIEYIIITIIIIIITTIMNYFGILLIFQSLLKQNKCLCLGFLCHLR